MSSYNQSINLQALPGSQVIKATVNGKEQTFVAIPVDAPYMFIGNKGVYASLTAFENKEQKFGNSHAVKPAFNKDYFEKLTDEQKRNIPIVGNLTPIEFHAQNEAVNNAQAIQVQTVTLQQPEPQQTQTVQQQPADGNLPF